MLRRSWRISGHGEEASRGTAGLPVAVAAWAAIGPLTDTPEIAANPSPADTLAKVNSDPRRGTARPYRLEPRRAAPLR